MDKKRKEINKILDKYDLVGIADVAENEYDLEAKLIINRLKTSSQDLEAKDIAIIIRNVYIEMFDKNIIPKDEKIYMDMACEIHNLYK